MSTGIDLWDHVFDPEGSLFPRVFSLYRAVLGHDAERRQDLQKSLGVTRQRMAKDLKDPPDVLNKTRFLLGMHALAHEARSRGVQSVIVPLTDCHLTVRTGSAVVLTADTPALGWDRAQPLLESYAAAVFSLVDESRRALVDAGVPHGADHVLVVGGVAMTFMALSLRPRQPDEGRVVRLPDAQPYAPEELAHGFTSPLDRFFHQRAGLPCTGPAKQELVWMPQLQSEAKAKQLQRWRLGAIDSKGSEIPSDFICRPEYRFACSRSAIDERVQFESLKASHGLWRYLHGHRLPLPIITRFVSRLLQIDIGCA